VEKPKNNNLGNVACDAFGNVLARMTSAGWEEVDPELGLRAEKTLRGNVFDVASEVPVNRPLMERAQALMERIGQMGDYVEPDHSGEWWDVGSDDDDPVF
jgi:hypothetical protein